MSSQNPLHQYTASLPSIISSSVRNNATNVDDLDYANLLVTTEVQQMLEDVKQIEEAKKLREPRRAALSSLWEEINSLDGVIDATESNVTEIEKLVIELDKKAALFLKKK